MIDNSLGPPTMPNKDSHKSLERRKVEALEEIVTQLKYYNKMTFWADPKNMGLEIE